MPILYESVFQPKTIRPKSMSRQVFQQAPYWHIIEVYKVGSIYMTAAQLASNLKSAIDNAATQKGLKVYSYSVLNEWAVWQGLYTDYYIRYDAIVGSASTMGAEAFIAQIALAAIIIFLAVVVGLIIILYIVLVAREVVEQLFNLVPSALKPAVATMLLVGGAAVAIGGGIFLISMAFRKRK
jgi:hypothetical protein